MALSELQIVNAALVKLAAAPLTALNDGSAESVMASALYPVVRDAVLSAYPWSFAVAQVVLSTPSSAPVADYARALDLPVDHLRTLSVGVDGRGAGTAYRQQNQRIETDAESVTLTYLRRVVPPAYPPYFDMVLVARLAAELCVPVTENAARAEVLYRIAEQEYARARSSDAQQDSQTRLTSFPLVDVRG